MQIRQAVVLDPFTIINNSHYFNYHQEIARQNSCVQFYPSKLHYKKYTNSNIFRNRALHIFRMILCFMKKILSEPYPEKVWRQKYSRWQYKVEEFHWQSTLNICASRFFMNWKMSLGSKGATTQKQDECNLFRYCFLSCFPCLWIREISDGRCVVAGILTQMFFELCS